MQLTVRIPADLMEALGAFREKLSKELGAEVSLSKAAIAAIRRGIPSVVSHPLRPKRERQRPKATQYTEPPNETGGKR